LPIALWGLIGVSRALAWDKKASGGWKWFLDSPTSQPEAFVIRQPDRVSSGDRSNLPGRHN
jgi:hypothetical protein